MIWYLIWNIKMANFNFLLYPRYRDTIGMDCDGNWYIPELEIVSLNWGYIPNFGDKPPKESNAEFHYQFYHKFMAKFWAAINQAWDHKIHIILAIFVDDKLALICQIL